MGATRRAVLVGDHELPVRERLTVTVTKWVMETMESEGLEMEEILTSRVPWRTRYTLL
jgi:hypothetical protein